MSVGPAIESDWERDTSFSSVSWAYHPDPTFRQPMIPHTYTIYAKPPYYHDTLCTSLCLSHCSSRHGCSTPSDLQSDILDDPDFIGINLANEVLATYEMQVGFHSTTSIPDLSLMPLDYDPAAVADVKENQKKITQALKEGEISPVAPFSSASSSSPRSPHETTISSCHPHAKPSILPAESSEYINRVSPTPHLMTPVRSASTSLCASTESSRPSSPLLTTTNFTWPSLNEPRHLSSPPSTHFKQGTRRTYREHISTHKGTTSSISPLREAGRKPGNDNAPISSPNSSPRSTGSPSPSSELSHSFDLDFFVPTIPDSATSFSSPPLSANGHENDGDGWIITPSVDIPIQANPTTEKNQPPSVAPDTLLVNDDGWIEGPSQPPTQCSPKLILRKHPYRAPLAIIPPPHPAPLLSPFVYPAPSYPTPVFAPVMATMPYPYTTDPYLWMDIHRRAQMQLQMPPSNVMCTNWYQPHLGFVPTPNALTFASPDPSAMQGSLQYGMPPVGYVQW